MEKLWKKCGKLILLPLYDTVIAYVYYVSAEETKKKARAWVFQAHENKSRKKCFGAKEKEGAQAHISVIMLKKKHRLLQRKDFSALFAAGRYIRGGFISLKILKNELSYARVGFVVGGKVAKKSTVRNLIKRRLRAIVRAFGDEIRGGIDVAVLPSAEIVNKDFKAIKKETRGVFEKARLL